MPLANVEVWVSRIFWRWRINQLCGHTFFRKTRRWKFSKCFQIDCVLVLSLLPSHWKWVMLIHCCLIDTIIIRWIARWGIWACVAMKLASKAWNQLVMLWRFPSRRSLAVMVAFVHRSTVPWRLYWWGAITVLLIRRRMTPLELPSARQWRCCSNCLWQTVQDAHDTGKLLAYENGPQWKLLAWRSRSYADMGDNDGNWLYIPLSIWHRWINH